MVGTRQTPEPRSAASQDAVGVFTDRRAPLSARGRRELPNVDQTDLTHSAYAHLGTAGSQLGNFTAAGGGSKAHTGQDASGAEPGATSNDFYPRHRAANVATPDPAMRLGAKRRSRLR